MGRFDPWQALGLSMGDQGDLLRALLVEKLRDDPKLAREVLLAAAKSAGTAPAATAAAASTLRQLWTEWHPVMLETYKAAETATAARRMLDVPVQRPDGSTLALGEWRPDELSRSTMDLYRAARTKMRSGRVTADGKPATISDTTVDREINTLQAMLTWHVEAERLVRNPIAKWRRSPPRRRQTSLTWEQFEEFVSYGPPIFQDMATVAFKCAGMRRGEILRLEKAELDHERHEIALRGERIKTDEDRIIPVDSETWAVLERRAAESRGPFVFVNPRDPKRITPVSIRTFYNWIKRCRRDSGMRGVHGESIVFHLARHGGLNDWLDAGVNPAHVSKAGGLSLVTLQKHYQKWQRSQRAHVQQQVEDHRAGQRRPARAPMPTPPPRVRSHR